MCVASHAVTIPPGGHHTADNDACGHHTAALLTSWLGGHHTADLASESTRVQAVTTPPAASNMYRLQSWQRSPYRFRHLRAIET